MIVIGAYKCDRCGRKNAFPMMLPMKKDDNNEIVYEHLEICAVCVMKMAQHLFASKVPSAEKQQWLANFMVG